MSQKTIAANLATYAFYSFISVKRSVNHPVDRAQRCNASFHVKNQPIKQFRNGLTAHNYTIILSANSAKTHYLSGKIVMDKETCT